MTLCKLLVSFPTCGFPTIRDMENTEYDTFLTKLGKRIQHVRVSLGFLQEDVAEMLGMTRVAIGYIEQGRRAPKLSTLYALARLYEVDIRTFFDFDDGV